jgi:hypothetical protein
MSVDQKIFVDGHIGKLQLRKLVKDPDGFDDDTVEMIWEHLDECEVCVAEYEAVQADHQPEEQASAAGTPPDPAAGSDGALEPDLLDPEDFESAKVVDPQKDDGQLNGVMPVGDDPARNGVSSKYKNGDRPTTVTVEPDPPADDAEEDASEAKEVAEGDKSDGRRPVLKVPQIEGLITGEVHELEVKPEKLETESPVDANERISTEDPEIDTATDEDEESPQDSETDVVENDSEIDISPPVDDPDDDVEDPLIDPVVEDKPAPRPASSKSPTPRTAPTAEKKSEPLEDAFNSGLAFLKRPRNAIIIGGVILVIAAAIVAAIVMTGNEKERLIAGWEPLDVIETRVPLQEVIIRKMYRGRIPRASGTDVTLDFHGIDRLVIAVDLDFIKGKTSPHDVIVRNPAGLNVYQEPIPQVYLDDGRFFLRLVPDQFEEGQTYKLELVTYHADETMIVVAESVFDVVK